MKRIAKPRDKQRDQSTVWPAKLCPWVIWAETVSRSLSARCAPSFQLGVFGFRGDEDGNAGVGVFPQSQEILIRCSGLGRITLKRIGTGDTQMRQRADWGIQDHAAMVDDFLEFRCRLLAAMGREVGFASQVSGQKVVKQARLAEHRLRDGPPPSWPEPSHRRAPEPPAAESRRRSALRPYAGHRG